MGGTHALALHIRRLLANAVQQNQQPGGLRNSLEKPSLSEATPSSHSSHSSAEDSGQVNKVNRKELVTPSDLLVQKFVPEINLFLSSRLLSRR